MKKIVFNNKTTVFLFNLDRLVCSYTFNCLFLPTEFKRMKLTNYHTHTFFSDGKTSPAECVAHAYRLGLNALGFSDHSPLPFENSFSLHEDRLPEYVAEIRRLQKENEGLMQIWLALEMDYIPGMSAPFAALKQQAGLDYVIGSVHLIGHSHQDNLWFTDGPDVPVYDEGLRRFYRGDIRRGVKAFYDQTNEMIQNETFDVIGHFDKIKMHNQGRYFSESDAWYRRLVLETLSLIREKGLIAEVNTRGIYKQRYNGLYPSGWLLHEMGKAGVPVIISSDAHHPSELTAEFDRAAETLMAAGYKSVMMFDNGQWIEQPLNDLKHR